MKFSWLKLPVDFFNQIPIKKLRRLAGGDTYVVIYQKLLLMTLSSNGLLPVELDDVEDLALWMDESPDNVRVVLTFLDKTNLVENTPAGWLLAQTNELAGRNSDSSASRVAKHRATKKLENKELLNVTNNSVTDVTVTPVTCNVTVTSREEKRREEREEKKPVTDKAQICKESHDIILKWYNHIFRSNVRKIGTEDRRRLDKYIAEYEVDGCIEMLLGVTLDDWMMGENPQNTKYIGWGNIFKLNEDNFSRFSTKYHAATGNGAKWVKDITSPVGVSWWSQEHFSMSTAPDTHPWRVIKEQDIFTSDLLNDKFEYVWTENETKEYTGHLESQRADKIVIQEVVTDGYQDPDDDTIPESWVIGDLEPVEDIAPWDDTNTPEPVF